MTRNWLTESDVSPALPDPGEVRTQEDEPVPLTQDSDRLAADSPATPSNGDDLLVGPSAEIKTSDGEMEEPAGTFLCGTCGGSFPSERVYDAGGVFICADCFLRQSAAAPVAAPTSPPPAAGAANVPSASITGAPTAHGRLLVRATCPHCWHRFPPDRVLWVSRHVDLLGDPVLGPETASRFLPSRFNVEGDAIDARGMACGMLACPRCRLPVPRSLLEIDPLFASIVGVSGSGKSYFLTAMTWELRRLLPKYMGVAFNDTDAVINRTINQFEETIFLQDDPDRPVQLEKTDVVGSQLYDQIRLGQQVVNLPKPFLFTLTALRGHPNAGTEDAVRLLCLYDNAGEHFNPGEDAAASPVTQHLSRSRVVLFLYDPTQDPRFRALLRRQSSDPQLDERSSARRQETILVEAGARLRRFAALAPGETNRRPLIVVVPKADVWGNLIGLDLSTEPMVAGTAAGEFPVAVDVPRIEAVSAAIRELFAAEAPEFVAVAEPFSSHVIYIPTSALGRSPQVREGHPGLWIKPGEVRPRWVTAPILYMFAKWSHGLIHRVRAGREPAVSHE